MIVVIVMLIAMFLASIGEKARRERIKKAFDYKPDQLLGVAGFATDEECKKAGLFSSRGIPCGHSPETGHPLRYDLDAMAITVAPVGSGKGTVQVIPAMLSMDDRSIFLISSKGDATSVVAKHRASIGPCNIVDAYGGVISGDGGVRRASTNTMDILSDPREPELNFYATSRSIAQGNIFLESQKSEGDFWNLSATNILHTVIMGVARHEPPENRTLLRVAEILSTPAVFDWAARISRITNDPILKQKLGPLVAARLEDRTMEGTLQTVRTNIDWVQDPAVAKLMSKSDFDIRSFRDRVQTLCITVPTNITMSGSRLNSVLINFCLNRLMTGGRSKKKVLFIIDDFTTYGALPCVESAVAICRGFGITIWPIIQDLSALEARYPRSWQTFLSNAGLRVFMTPQDEKTAVFVSQQLGVSQVSGWQKSVNFDVHERIGEGWSRPPVSRPLEHPDEVRACPDDLMYVFVRGMAKAIKARRIPYFKQWALKRKAQPDPYYRPESFLKKVFGG